MNPEKRTTPLLDPTEKVSESPSARSVYTTFLFVTFFFSLNHGTVTALIALASSDLGDLGRYCTGTLYIMYTVVALLFSALIVSYTGFKWGLFAGLAVYCFYVCSFLVYRFVPEIATEAALVGSGIGGIAAGFLWTAQGGYFALACQLYARASGKKPEEVTGSFGAIFGAIYLFGEVSLKFASSLITSYLGGEETVYIVFSIIAVGSAIGMMFVLDLQKFPHPDPNYVAPPKPSVTAKLIAAANLITSDPKMALMLPVQMSFGFISVFLNSYSNANIVKAFLGSSNVGYLSGIVAAFAGIVSTVSSKLSKKIGKMPILVTGGIVFTAECAIFLAFSDKTLGTWGWCVVLYLLHGAGRGIFESTNKAVIADFFPTKAPAAFANVIVSSGGASSIGFFLFPNVSRDVQLVVCIIFAVLHIFTAFQAFSVFRKQ
eukprot:c18881_g1_i1.p1 GENE.c18881_g1_i1~~c18881_g1_i1.p1  ORF type:complete len:458 (+),score=177.54 c18881_g1_i1:84-1376(+)